MFSCLPSAERPALHGPTNSSVLQCFSPVKQPAILPYLVTKSFHSHCSEKDGWHFRPSASLDSQTKAKYNWEPCNSGQEPKFVRKRNHMRGYFKGISSATTPIPNTSRPKKLPNIEKHKTEFSWRSHKHNNFYKVIFISSKTYYVQIENTEVSDSRTENKK